MNSMLAVLLYARLGRWGPSPTTSCGSPCHLYARLGRWGPSPTPQPHDVLRLALQDCDGARPAGGGAADLHGETRDREAVGRQRLEVVQLLEVAVADLASGLVALPDQRG